MKLSITFTIFTGLLGTAAALPPSVEALETTNLESRARLITLALYKEDTCSGDFEKAILVNLNYCFPTQGRPVRIISTAPGFGTKSETILFHAHRRTKTDE